jgi:hypothetical protein
MRVRNIFFQYFFCVIWSEKIFHFPSWWYPERNILLSFDHNTSNWAQFIDIEIYFLPTVCDFFFSYLHLSHQMKMGRSYTIMWGQKKKILVIRDWGKKINYYRLFMSKRNRKDIYICSSKNRLTSSGFLDLFCMICRLLLMLCGWGLCKDVKGLEFLSNYFLGSFRGTLPLGYISIPIWPWRMTHPATKTTF